MSKTISDGNNNLTPVIQARTRDLNLGIGMAPMSQYVMNKIERKDIPSKPPIDKPKLTKEHMAIQYSDDIKKSKTSKSKKVTYEKNKNKKRKSSHGIASFFPTKLNSEKLEEKLDKFEEDRNKFEQVKEPIKNTEIKREIACMTPGINKRKLTREANTVIDSQNKQVTSINKIPPFKNVRNISNFQSIFLFLFVIRLFLFIKFSINLTMQINRTKIRLRIKKKLLRLLTL